MVVGKLVWSQSKVSAKGDAWLVDGAGVSGSGVVG